MKTQKTKTGIMRTKQDFDCIKNEPGFLITEGLNRAEYQEAVEHIREHWLSIIEQHYPDAGKIAREKNISMKEYMKIESMLKHGELWTKKNRILPAKFYSWLHQTEFFAELESIFENLTISDEEGIGRPNIYWRLVRPNNRHDVGPMHRDSWFWELNKNFGEDLRGKKRIKAWIDIHTKINLNGLLVVPNSHRDKNIRFTAEKRHGTTKPKIDSIINTNTMRMPRTKKGDCILFNDDLVHGGSLNKSKETRVSFEFTIIARDN